MFLLTNALHLYATPARLILPLQVVQTSFKEAAFSNGCVTAMCLAPSGITARVFINQSVERFEPVIYGEATWEPEADHLLQREERLGPR